MNTSPSQISVHIDGSFLIKQIDRIVGRSFLNPDLFRSKLISYIQERWGIRLLRVYWYDSPSIDGNLGQIQEKISILNDFKVRLGWIGYFEHADGSSQPRQKGVDGLLIADMISLAQHRSVTDMLLVAGDADLIPAVTVSQAMGIRVHVACPKDVNGSLSRMLRVEADTVDFWDTSFLESFVPGAVEIPVISKNYAVMLETDPIAKVALAFYSTLSAKEKIEACKKVIPSILDRRLLTAAIGEFGRTNLSDHLKKSLRREVRRLAQAGN